MKRKVGLNRLKLMPLAVLIVYVNDSITAAGLPGAGTVLT